MKRRNGRRGPLVIRVSIDQLQPLTGSASTAGCEEKRFLGWLELLRTFSELVASASATDDRTDARRRKARKGEALPDHFISSSGVQRPLDDAWREEPRGDTGSASPTRTKE